MTSKSLTKEKTRVQLKIQRPYAASQ